MKLWSNSTVPGSGGFIPEKRLLVAVLQRAVADFVGGEDETSQEAGAWIMSDDDESESEAPLSFQFICEALDLDHPTLRKAIVAQAQKNSSGLREGLAV